jgi:hypothetical protein
MVSILSRNYWRRIVEVAADVAEIPTGHSVTSRFIASSCDG